MRVVVVVRVVVEDTIFWLVVVEDTRARGYYKI